MNAACFLAPIHAPKFDYGINFVTSYNKFYPDNHIFLVFSNSKEAFDFYKLAKGLRYRSIICTNPPGDSPTTEKKFYGLQWIFSHTEFVNVGVVDVDCSFTKTVDYADLFVKYYERGILFGNNYEFAPPPMIQGPLKFYNEQDQEQLTHITQGHRVYFWFNDIPVFNKEHFLNFVQYINYPARVHELTWFDFDFNIYGYYLLVKGIFKLEIMTVDNEPLPNIFIEDQYIIPPDVFKQLFAKCRPMWIKQDIDNELMTHTFMNVHVDRPRS
jgi:hypothetical protein